MKYKHGFISSVGRASQHIEVGAGLTPVLILTFNLMLALISLIDRTTSRLDRDRSQVRALYEPTGKLDKTRYN